MSYRKTPPLSDLNNLAQRITNSKDAVDKLAICSELLVYLSDSNNVLEFSDAGSFVKTVISLLHGSHYKLIQIGLDILTELVSRMRTDFKPYYATLVPHLVEKLGDSKDVTREKGVNLFRKLVECDVVKLACLFEKLSLVGFSHKNSNVREQTMLLLQFTLDEYGTSALYVSKLVPAVVELTSDSNESVRATAFNTLCHIYKHVGERLRTDLQKNYAQIPRKRLFALMCEFDKIKAAKGTSNDNGLSAMMSERLKITSNEEPPVDQCDNSRNYVKSYNSNGTVASVGRSRVPNTPSGSGFGGVCSSTSKSNRFQSTTSSSSSSSCGKSIPTTTSSHQSGTAAGAVDEDTFLASFEDVPDLRLGSCRDVEENLRKLRTIIDNVDEDWGKRVDALRRIRSLMKAAGSSADFEECFCSNLNCLLSSFQASLKDLRSQVVREACISVAYLSKELALKLDRFAESLLHNNLIGLIQNSAKVVASSAYVCIRFILQYTHAPRLIPVIVNNLTNSKSKEIRKACCEFIYLILLTWSTNSIHRYALQVQTAIANGIADANPDARIHSKNAYREFSVHFPKLAENLKDSLDDRQRKRLECDSNSGSMTSLSRIPTVPSSASVSTKISLRSNSAIDLQAVIKAKSKAQYVTVDRQKLATCSSSGAAKQTTPRAKNYLATPHFDDDQNRVGRTKSRISISQPNSRSGSPSSRYCYNTYLYSGGGGGTNNLRSCSKYSAKPTSAQKMLQQSRESESRLSAALGSCGSPSFKLSRANWDDHSDESETSSMCSEHSFDSNRRPSFSDTRSWNGSQNRLYGDHCRSGEPSLTDINDIVAFCENDHWNERREGLQSLLCYLQDGNRLQLGHLRRIMDVFTRSFNDSRIKVFSLFLDTLNELVRTHNEDLCYCLHLLLTKLFTKLGTDLLNSVYSKIMKTLDVVYDSFPAELQLQSVFRFLVDPTQTPNWRVKLIALNYIIKLSAIVDSSRVFNNVIDSSSASTKDYPTMALEMIVGWTIDDHLKNRPELQQVARETILALFNLHPSQVATRFTTMSIELQKAASVICKNRSRFASSSDENDLSRSTNDSPEYSNTPNNHNNTTTSSSVSTIRSSSSNTSSSGIPKRKYSFSRADRTTPTTLNTTTTTAHHNGTLPAASTADRSDRLTDEDYETMLRTYVEDLSHCSLENVSRRTDLISNVALILEYCPSDDVIVANFKPLLLIICNLLIPTESSTVKELTFSLLQIIVKRKTIMCLLKDYSDLILTKIIALANDSSVDVIKAAENCAIILATFLPAESVIRVAVPLITSEDTPVKLLAIKMLTRSIECSDCAVAMAEIDPIMNALLASYNNEESTIRKAAVFCMVALHKQSEQMKACLEPYFSQLQGAKLKLLQMYINRADQGSSIPGSPK